MDDETLLLLASKGGVVQIPALHEFIKTDPPGVMEAFYALLDEFGISMDTEARTLPANQREAFERRNAEMLERWPLATVRDFVGHIDHVVDLVGVDHVGIGSDFDGGAGLTGWASASETPNVTAELIHRGYTEEDIQDLGRKPAARVGRRADRGDWSCQEARFLTSDCCSRGRHQARALRLRSPH